MKPSEAMGLRIRTSASCSSRGADNLLRRCKATAQSRNAHWKVKGVGCFGPCSDGPLLAVDAEASSRLFSLDGASTDNLHDDLKQVRTAQELNQWQPHGSRLLRDDDPFMALQRRLVLDHCSRIDPDCIKEAEHEGAYEQLQRVLNDATPEAVIEQVRLSGLRGRGGAGYPTGLKWATVAAMPGAEKVLVCNADEGDPGAFMDRTVMEGQPHTLIEGMAIAAFAVGAQRGVIYVRAEYPLAMANEGRMLLFCPPGQVPETLAVLRRLCPGATRIGVVGDRLTVETARHERYPVSLISSLGVARPLDLGHGEQLPRIC